VDEAKIKANFESHVQQIYGTKWLESEVFLSIKLLLSWCLPSWAGLAQEARSTILIF
jgi:hypothetical protein